MPWSFEIMRHEVHTWIYPRIYLYMCVYISIYVNLHVSTDPYVHGHIHEIETCFYLCISTFALEGCKGQWQFWTSEWNSKMHVYKNMHTCIHIIAYASVYLYVNVSVSSNMWYMMFSWLIELNNSESNELNGPSASAAWRDRMTQLPPICATYRSQLCRSIPSCSSTRMKSGSTPHHIYWISQLHITYGRQLCRSIPSCCQMCTPTGFWYVVASVSRIDKIISLLCKRTL